MKMKLHTHQRLHYVTEIKPLKLLQVIISLIILLLFQSPVLSNAVKIVSSLSSYTAGTIENRDWVPNIVRVDSSWFDEATNEIVLKWYIDTSKSPGGKIFKSGYSYKHAGPLDTINNIPARIDSVNANNNITRVRVPDLVWNSTYTVGIWLCSYNDVSGPGTLSTPTDSSTVVVNIPSFTWQVVTFFHNNGTNSEVIEAANGKIRLRETNDFSAPEQDTLRAYHPNESALPQGMVLINTTSFKFCRTNYQIPDFMLELLYISLPPGITVNDVGLYQDIKGDIKVVDGFNVDAVNKVVSAPVGIDDLTGYPFLVLADTSIIGIQEDNHTNYLKPNNFIISYIHGDISIHYSIPYFSPVKIEAYDIQGKLVKVITDKFMQKGSYIANWDSVRFGSGVYYIKLSVRNNTLIRKVVIMK